MNGELSERYVLEEDEQRVVLPVDLFDAFGQVGRQWRVDGNAWRRPAQQVRHHVVHGLHLLLPIVAVRTDARLGAFLAAASAVVVRRFLVDTAEIKS